MTDPIPLLFRAAARFPRTVLLVVAVASVSVTPFLANLRLRTDGAALVPEDDPAVAADRRTRAVFGIKDPIVVVVESLRREAVFNVETTTIVRELTREIAGIDGVSPADVMSLATEKRPRVWPGTLTLRPFLEPPPRTPQDFHDLEYDLDETDILYGTLVSRDRRSTAILVGVAPTADRAGILRAVENLASARRTPSHQLRVVGAPVAEVRLGLHILDDLALLVPICVGVITVLMYVLTRNAWAVALVMVKIGFAQIVTFSCMALCGVPVYLSTAVLPVVLTAMGITDEIHIFNAYSRRVSATGGPTPSPIHETMEALWRPVRDTSVTSALALLSFALSPIDAVRYFGVFAAVGMIYCMIWALTVTPAALALIPPARFARRRGAPAAPDAVLAALGGWVVRRARPVLAAIALGAVATSIGLGRVFVQDSWVDGFARSSAFYQDTRAVNDSFHGTHLLQIDCDASATASGRVDAAFLESVGRLEGFLASRPDVGGVLGAHSHFTTINYLVHRTLDARSIPHDQQRFDYCMKQLKEVRGEQRAHEIIDADQRRALVTVFLKEANFRDTAALMAATDEFVARTLAPSGFAIGYAGDVAVSQAMIPAIVRTQRSSVVASLVLVFVITGVWRWSASRGLCCLLPPAFAVMVAFSTMGWLGIPLGVATSMFCAITIGVGVDYAIHFVEQVRHARTDGIDLDGAIVQALVATGPAMLVDAVAIACGFATLLFSAVPANSRLGTLVAASIAACLAMTVFGLPALIATWKPRFVSGPRPMPTQADPV